MLLHENPSGVEGFARKTEGIMHPSTRRGDQGELLPLRVIAITSRSNLVAINRIVSGFEYSKQDTT